MLKELKVTFVRGVRLASCVTLPVCGLDISKMRVLVIFFLAFHLSTHTSLTSPKYHLEFSEDTCI